MSYKVELMQETVMNLLGKNLFYWKENNDLLWCDVLGGQVFEMDLDNHNMLRTFMLLGEKTISFCIPIHGKEGHYIVGAGRRLLHVTWDGQTTMGTIVKVLCEIPVNGVRLNKCRVDKQGRLLFGTILSEEHGESFDMNRRICALYRFTMNEGLVVLKDKLGMCNGIAFNKTFNKLFLIDSYDLLINEFDYDIKSGTLGSHKVLIDLAGHGQKTKVFPSSMTMDSEDHIYCCMFGGGKILKIDTRTGKIDHEIKLNIEQPTGCEFGGKHLDTLYVVSAGMGLHRDLTYPAGYLVKVHHLGATGMEMHRFMM